MIPVSAEASLKFVRDVLFDIWLVVIVVMLPAEFCLESEPESIFDPENTESLVSLREPSDTMSSSWTRSGSEASKSIFAANPLASHLALNLSFLISSGVPATRFFGNGLSTRPGVCPVGKSLLNCFWTKIETAWSDALIWSRSRPPKSVSSAHCTVAVSCASRVACSSACLQFSIVSSASDWLFE